MRQAIIVQNPKWERFTTVSDAFKSLTVKEKESAVLVVRGRCKEKTHQKGPRVFKKLEADSPECLAADLRKKGASVEDIKKAVEAFGKKAAKAAVLLLLAFGLAMPTFAQQNILGLLPVTTMAAVSTNNTGNGTIGWNLGDVLIFQAVLQSTNNVHISTKSNVFLYLDATMAGTTWATNQYTVSFPTHTYQTNAVASFATITNTIGATWLRIGQQCNPNTNVVIFNSLDVLKPSR